MITPLSMVRSPRYLNQNISVLVRVATNMNDTREPHEKPVVLSVVHSSIEIILLLGE